MRGTARALMLLLLTASACAAQNQLFVDIKADHVQLQPERDAVVYSGNIEITYEDAVIRADNCTFETGTNQAVFTGSVFVQWADHTIEAVWVFIDFEARTYRAETCRVEFPPSFFGSRYVRDSMFISAAAIEGDAEEIRLRDAFISPCDRYIDPHFGLETHTVKVYREGKWIRTSAIKAKVKNMTVFWLPGFAIRTRYFTGTDYSLSFGKSTYDGFWGETKWYYNDNGSWDVRVTQERGTKLSHDYYFGLGNSGEGSSLVTYDTKQGSFTGNVRYAQRIGTSTRADGSYDVRQTSTNFSGSSTSQNRRLNFSRDVGSLGLRASYSSSTTSTASSDPRTNQTASVSLDKELWGDRGSQATAGIDTRITSNTVTGGLVNDEMNTHAEFSQPWDYADFKVLVDKRTDLDGAAYDGDNSYSTLDRLPEVVTSFNLRDWNIDQFGGRGTVSLGRFSDSAKDLQRNRLGFDFDGSLNPIKVQDHTTLNISGLYKQRVYRADEANYTLGASASMRTDIGSFARSDFSWSYRMADGYTPFRSDYFSESHSVRGGLDFDPTQYIKLGLSTSYDIKNDRWSDVRAQFSHRRGLSNFSLSTGYGIDTNQWSTINARYGLTVIDHFTVDVSALYDIEAKELRTVRGQLDWEPLDKWRVEWLTAWNGSRSEFTTNTARLTHEFHDFYATASYDRPRELFEVGVSLKALPTLISDIFGAGRAGEYVDTTIPTGGGF